jgi:dihydrofolate synthase/folylpolyglutamate synthase
LPQDNHYLDALDKLFALEFTGMKLGLENISELLASLGNPQEKYPTIHVAGTNGKGSVSSMLAAALQANGYKTGLYTSPHLVSFTERIKINGEEIPREYVADFLESNWHKVEELKATFFEVTTALMFKYFADMKVDVAVIETGLGGRLDGTNVLRQPLATVITSIGLEHTQILGDTLELIAGEKAGIFKQGSPAIVNVEEQLHHVFTKKAYEEGTSVTFVDNRSDLPTVLSDMPLMGRHQQQNIRTVLATLALIKLPVDTQKAYHGIINTASLTKLRARLETLSYAIADKKGVKLMLDVGHNAPAFEYLREYFQGIGIKPIVVAGFAKDKDVDDILLIIKSFSSLFIAVAADMHRALSAEELHRIALSNGIDSVLGGSVNDGIALAISNASKGDVILLFGSHYVVGEFLATLPS